MTSYAPFKLDDLFEMNFVNADQLTETYSTAFYGEYFVHWPEYQRVARHPSGLMMGYVLGKAEGDGEDWHGHVSALTVAPRFRRLGLAEEMMKSLEDTTKSVHNAYFVDLFVRDSNKVAIAMYQRLGYIVFRRVLKYYSASASHDEEDALDMRKAMPRDRTRKVSSVIPLTKSIFPNELEWQ